MSVVLYVVAAYLTVAIVGLNKVEAQTTPLPQEILTSTDQSVPSIIDQPCQTINETDGICKKFFNCPVYKICGDEDGCDGDTADYMMSSLCETNDANAETLFCCPITNITDTRTTSILLPIPIDECGIEADFPDRIYNGEKTEIGEFPWMALIKYTKNSIIEITTTPNTKESISRNNNTEREFKCGGTLINQRYILTAGHCVAGSVLRKYTPQSVRLGEYDLSSEIDCQENNKLCADRPIDIEIEEIIVHENFNKISTISNFDIALIRLKENVNSTKFIKPICLPSSEVDDEHDYVKNNDKLFVTGWGSTENGTFSDIKLKATISLVDPNRCKQIYQNHIEFQNQLCGSGENGGDSCSGDSGGGLMGIQKLKNFQQYWYIIGVVSFGPDPCGRENFPGTYTSVNKYMQWILEHLKP